MNLAAPSIVTSTSLDASLLRVGHNCTPRPLYKRAQNTSTSANTFLQTTFTTFENIVCLMRPRSCLHIKTQSCSRDDHKSARAKIYTSEVLPGKTEGLNGSCLEIVVGRGLLSPYLIEPLVGRCAFSSDAALPSNLWTS